MARPAKEGLDYFPHDVNLDEKFEYVEAVHGIVGYGIVWKLYERIYRSGYFIPWTEKDITLFASKIQGASRELVEKIVAVCLSEGIFSQEAFASHKILTSSGIQKRYLHVTKRREKRLIAQEHCLVQLPDSEVVSVDRNHGSGNGNGASSVDSSGNNATKNSKEKDSTENKSTASAAADLEEKYPLEETLLQHWGRAGRIGHGVLLQFVDLARKHGWERVEYAIKEAAGHNACSLAYVKGILEPKEKVDEVTMGSKQDYFAFQTFLTQSGKHNGTAYNIDTVTPGKEWKFSGAGITDLYKQFKSKRF